MLTSGIFHDHVTFSMSHLQYDSFRISWNLTHESNDFRKRESVRAIWPFFDPSLTIQWSFTTIKTNDLTRQWIDDNCNNSLPRGYYFKMQIEQKFSYHDSSYSYPLEVTSPIRQSRIFLDQSVWIIPIVVIIWLSWKVLIWLFYGWK